MKNSILYFAYGSNIDQQRMKKRCSTAEFLSKGFISNYNICFNRKGTYIEGGVASIESNKGRNVYGIVYKISKEDLDTLDYIEDPSAYIRKSIKVQIPNNKFLNCYLYVSIPEIEISPNQEYLENIIKHASVHNFPEEYIDYLREFQFK
ncbi:hypothetical protein CL684_03185 [Candidatus Campbellbacteria bacterium]|nr:hypothetical protein [Candidatus Campbellbacteria bacterium]|tara:strand:+ start:241 stop:687 length:447 start_codon:yes stop_codon:yes gene_type:complete